MYERSSFNCTRDQHFLDFRRFSPGCPFLIAIVPRRASSRSPDRRGRPRPCPHRLVGACAKFETQALSPVWHRLSITLAPALISTTCVKNMPYLDLGSTPSAHIWYSCAFTPYHFYPFNPPCSRTPNLSTAVSSANRAGFLTPDTLLRRKKFPLHSGSSSSINSSSWLSLLPSVTTTIINTSYQKLPFGSGDDPDTTYCCCSCSFSADSRESTSSVHWLMAKSRAGVPWLGRRSHVW